MPRQAHLRPLATGADIESAQRREASHHPLPSTQLVCDCPPPHATGLLVTGHVTVSSLLLLSSLVSNTLTLTLTPFCLLSSIRHNMHVSNIHPNAFLALAVSTLISLIFGKHWFVNHTNKHFASQLNRVREQVSQ